MNVKGPSQAELLKRAPETEVKNRILVADDDDMVRDTVSRILETFGYVVQTADGGRQLLEMVDDSYDVILLDIDMPDLNGFETIRGLDERGYDIPVLFLTGSGSLDHAVRAINMGVYDFLTKPIDDLDHFHAKIRRAIEKRMYVLQERRYKEALEDNVQKKSEQLRAQNKLLRSYSNSLETATVQLMSSLQNAMEEKDGYTAGHTRRVTRYAVKLGIAMELENRELVVLRRAAQFHDIGKLVIDLSCIQKPETLSDEEWELIKKHPGVGANIIKPLGFMEREQFIIKHHHERMDGMGYPRGLTGDQLDDLTKIIMVVDSYDAMTSFRKYRRNKNQDEAIEELHDCSGTQFDPATVDIFAKHINEFIPDQMAAVDTFDEDFNQEFNH
jgi:response regulator RpfG family c-di-GMP phosphodiesterase